MTDAELKALLPKEETSVGFAASIAKLEAALTKTKAEADRLVGLRTEKIVSRDLAGAREMAPKISAMQSEIKDIEDILPLLRADMEALRHNEEMERFRNQKKEIDYEGKRQAFRDVWEKKYPALARDIAAILRMELELLDCRVQANAINAKLRELGDDDVQDYGIPAWEIAGARLSALSFGELVRLPGVRGSPEIRPVMQEKEEVERVSIPADAPEHRGYWVAGEARQIVRTEERVRTILVPTVPVVDEPVWWPAKRRRGG